MITQDDTLYLLNKYNSVSGDTQVLAVNKKIVAAREKNQLVTAFHPKLFDDA